MNLKGKVGKVIAKKVAKAVIKEDFLKELKTTWVRILPKEFDRDKVLDDAITRIRKSDFSEAFDIVGLTREDLSKVLQEVVGERG